jgi:hypothetical protein
MRYIVYIGLLSSPITNSDDVWSKNAKTFYSSCVNRDVFNLTELYAIQFLSNELGGWPMMTGASNPYSPLDLLERMYKYGFIDFATISIFANPNDPLNRTIIVSI